MFGADTILKMIGPETIGTMAKEHGPAAIKAIVEAIVAQAMPQELDPTLKGPFGVLLFVEGETTMATVVEQGTNRELGTYSVPAMIASIDFSTFLK
jgi:hypothetical protein